MSNPLTVLQVSQILGVHVTTVRRWITSGSLDATTIIYKNRPVYRIARETLNRVLGQEIAAV